MRDTVRHQQGVRARGHVESREPFDARPPVVFKTDDGTERPYPRLILDGGERRADLAPHRIVFGRVHDTRDREVDHRPFGRIEHVIRHCFRHARRDETAAPDFAAATFTGLAASASAETTLQRIQRTNEVRIGYANETPFAYTTPDGTVTGESLEIAKKIFARLGVKKVDAVL